MEYMENDTNKAMTRLTWDGTEQQESKPKDYSRLEAEYMRTHYPRLWEWLAGYEEEPYETPM